MNTTELRESARRIWEAALAAANPAVCVRNTIQRNGGSLTIGGKKIPLGGCVVVVGCGKASGRMAQAVEEILGDKVSVGLVVTKHGYGLPLNRIQISEAGHPIPDAAGVHAVEETRKLLADLTS